MTHVKMHMHVDAVIGVRINERIPVFILSQVGMQDSRNAIMPFPTPISRDRVIWEFPKVHPVFVSLQFNPCPGKLLLFTVVKMVRGSGHLDVKLIRNM